MEAIFSRNYIRNTAKMHLLGVLQDSGGALFEDYTPEWEDWPMETLLAKFHSRKTDQVCHIAETVKD